MPGENGDNRADGGGALALLLVSLGHQGQGRRHIVVAYYETTSRGKSRP